MKPLIPTLAFMSLLSFASCNTPQMLGGYTDYRKPTAEEKTLFSNAYKGDLHLTPKKVATQVVAGTNYSFICKDEKHSTYQVVIYQPLPGHGEAEVSRVAPNNQ